MCPDRYVAQRPQRNDQLVDRITTLDVEHHRAQRLMQPLSQSQQLSTRKLSNEINFLTTVSSSQMVKPYWMDRKFGFGCELRMYKGVDQPAEQIRISESSFSINSCPGCY